MAQPRDGSVAVGVELDVLPYATGGYFGAVWAGKGHLRGRALLAHVQMPGFIIPEGFTNNDITSYALLADYFPDARHRGWWLGGGLVLWRGSIQADARVETAAYESYLLNGSVGYARCLTPHLYLSPWMGLSARVGGDARILVDGQRYKPPVLNPEASLKFGWRF